MNNTIEVTEDYTPGDKSKELASDNSNIKSGLAAFAVITGIVIILSPKLRIKFKKVNSIFDIIKLFKIL
ncbi:MAG TPA: hypothetical protein PKY81_15055 [bacterium]|nr:hypothetical protein [bacterium]HPN32268.1 hypothetical protein [bacterium]